jgi:capsular polysaccharide biosynthesis protein
MASRVWEHAPGGTETVEPLMVIPGSLERVVSGPTDFGAPIPREEVIGFALRRERKVLPTTLYEIRDALVSHGSVYAWGHRYALTWKPAREAFRSAAETIDEAVLATSTRGSFYFGHWIAEDGARQLLAESLGPEVIDIVRPIYKHEPGYRELLELRAPRQVEHALVRKLTVIVEEGGAPFDWRRRMATLRERLRKNLGPLPPAQRGVYVDRGATGSRRSLINKDVVIALLKERGFSVIEPEKLTPRQVATAFATAKFIIGVDGSHLFPAIVSMSTGSTVIELHPANRFYPVQRDYLSPFGIKYAMLVCPHRNEAEFEAKLDELDSLLQLCGAED